MHLERRVDISHQISEACTRLMAGAQVMHIAKGPLDGVGARTIGRQKEQLKARVICEPLFDGYRFMEGALRNSYGGFLPCL